MTNPSDIPNNLTTNLDDMREQAEKKYNEFVSENPELGQNVQKAQNFYERNKPAILTAVGCVVLYKLEKRMVRKVVTKALREGVTRVDLPAYMSDLDAFYAARMATNTY